MRVRVDHRADAVYINLTDRPIKDSEQVADGIIVRMDDPAVLKQFSFELPTIG